MKFFCFIFALVALSQSGTLPAGAHWEHEHDKKNAQKKSTSKKKTQKANQFDPWKLLEMALEPANASTSNVQIYEQGVYRIIRSNGIPNHMTGAFPNAGNPNTMSEQTYVFRMPAKPKESGSSIELGMYPFGVAINGIPFDPGANEFWNNNRYSGWQYEAMYLGPKLGLDSNNAHVQPNGAYHYHGIPTGLLNKLSKYNRPVLLGYAADGFPIYSPYGYTEPWNAKTQVKKLKSSYKLKREKRANGPGGFPDGSFVQDFYYVPNSGDLDECNGRRGVTPEFPSGTYYYVITQDYPFIPRRFKGFPDQSFKTRGGSGGQPGGRPGARTGQSGGGYGGNEPPFGGPPPHGGPPGQGQGQWGPPPHGGPPGQGQWGPPPHGGTPPHGGPPGQGQGQGPGQGGPPPDGGHPPWQQ